MNVINDTIIKHKVSPLKKDMETLKRLPKGSYIHAHELPSGTFRIKVPAKDEEGFKRLREEAKREIEEA